jgi:hypothetical protein
MRKQINKSLLLSVVMVTTLTTPSFAQYEPLPPKTRSRSQCVSQLTNKRGTITVQGDCIPYQIWINPEYGTEYARLVQIGIERAASKNDYNTAIINFRRAQRISGVTDSEVRRALLGAVMAKAIQENPVTGYTPRRLWILVTGEYGSYPNYDL